MPYRRCYRRQGVKPPFLTTAQFVPLLRTRVLYDNASQICAPRTGVGRVRTVSCEVDLKKVTKSGTGSSIFCDVELNLNPASKFELY